MSIKACFAVAAASAALIAGAAPAGAHLISNSITHNSLVHNTLAPTASAAAVAQLRELNGVAVEAVTLPGAGVAGAPLLAFNPQPDPPGLQGFDDE